MTALGQMRIPKDSNDDCSGQPRSAADLIDDNCMSKAPIALFVYNRPRHTRLTVEALQKNELSEESDLFIFSDAPKDPGIAIAVQEVREYIRCIGGFKSVTIIERDENLGLASSIIDGVTRLCSDYGRVIVLEDDIVTSPYFLSYMNRALDLYENEERVVCVGAYMFPIRDHLPETFFLRITDCWGWGTWARGWASFDPDGHRLLREINSRKLNKLFDINGSYPYTRILADQARGENDSWSIRWYASAFLQDRLTLYPGRSLTNNIGFDGSGQHCESNNRFDNLPTDRPIELRDIPVEENQYVLAEIERFMRRSRRSLSAWLRSWLSRLV